MPAAALLLLLAPTPAGSADLAQGVALYDRCALEEAAAIFEALRRQPGATAEATYYLGRTRLAQRRYEEAVEVASRAIELAAGGSRYHLALGEALGLLGKSTGNPIQRLRLARKALAAFRRAVDLDPDNLTARFALVNYYARAPWPAGGSRQRALAEAAAIVERDPSWGERARGAVHRHTGDPEGAGRAYRQALAIDPSNREARHELGRLHLSLGRYPEALETFAALADSDPEDRRALYHLGEAAALSGQRLERGAAALQALLGSPICPHQTPPEEAYYHLGLIYRSLGRSEAARDAFQGALVHEPHHAGAKEALGPS